MNQTKSGAGAAAGFRGPALSPERGPGGRAHRPGAPRGGSEKFYEVSLSVDKLRIIYFHNTNSSELWRFATYIPEELEDEDDEKLAEWVLQNWPDADTVLLLPQMDDRTGIIVLDEEARVLNDYEEVRE